MNARKQAAIRDITRNINEAWSKGQYKTAVRVVSCLAIEYRESKLALDFVQLMLDTKQDKEHEIYAGTRCGKALFENSCESIDYVKRTRTDFEVNETLAYSIDFAHILLHVLNPALRQQFSRFHFKTLEKFESDLAFDFDRVAFAVAVLRGYIFAMYPEHEQELDSSDEARLVFMSQARNQANIYKAQAA